MLEGVSSSQGNCASDKEFELRYTSKCHHKGAFLSILSISQSTSCKLGAVTLLLFLYRLTPPKPYCRPQPLNREAFAFPFCPSVLPFFLPYVLSLIACPLLAPCLLPSNSRVALLDATRCGGCSGTAARLLTRQRRGAAIHPKYII